MTNPWIIKLKQCSREYQQEKLNRKMKKRVKSPQMTKGQKQFKTKVNSIEKKVMQKQKMYSDLDMVRRIRGGRF